MKTRHVHFLVLLSILIGGIATFLYVDPHSSLRLIVGIVTTVAYVAWGLIHHALEKDLHQRVVVEYMLIGAIALVLLFTMLKG